MSATVAFVVIGRDEGANIDRALRSVLTATAQARVAFELVFVDSGSTDDSVARARPFAAWGCKVVQLERASSSAAIARNRGFAVTTAPLVHFLDGDMQLEPGWLEMAMQRLRTQPRLGAVAGLLQERSLDYTLWGATFGLDWDHRIGQVPTLGGAALWRRQVLEQLGGFDERLRYGEDPDLCLRAGRLGWQCERLAAVMAQHDLGLLSLRAWWQRALACGSSRAAIRRKHGRQAVRRTHRILAVVLGLTALAPFAPALACALLLSLPVLLIARRAALDFLSGNSPLQSVVHALHTYAVKVPLAIGATRPPQQPQRQPS